MTEKEETQFACDSQLKAIRYDLRDCPNLLEREIANAMLYWQPLLDKA
jgi:hypothetical protein